MYVLFIKGHGLIANGILLYEKLWNITSKYTHVGLVVHKGLLDKKISDLFCLTNDFYILESTLSGVLNDSVNSSCDKTIFGPQFRSFDDFVSVYSKFGDVKAKLVEMDQSLSLNLCNYLGKRYDYNVLNLTMIHVPYIYYKNDKYFCSDLITSLLKDNGMVDKNINSKKVSPNKLYKLLKKNKLTSKEITLCLN